MQKNLIIAGGAVVVLALAWFGWQYYQDSQWLTYTSEKGYIISFPKDWQLDTSGGLVPGDAILDPEREAFVAINVQSEIPPIGGQDELTQILDTLENMYRNTEGQQVDEFTQKPFEDRDDLRLYMARGTYTQADGSQWAFTEVGSLLAEGILYAARASVEPDAVARKEQITDKILESIALAGRE